MEIETVLYQKKPRKKRRINKLTGEKIYTQQQLEKQLLDVMCKHARLRDGMCRMGSMWGNCGGVLSGGHVIPRQKSRAVKFDEGNIFGQCGNHNYLHQRHPQLYYSWYVDTFGADEFTALVQRSKQPYKPMKKEEIVAKIRYYQQKIRNL